MLFVVFLIAVLNLAIGYALGSGMTLSSILACLPSRTPKAPPADIEEEEALTRPVANTIKPVADTKVEESPTEASPQQETASENTKKQAPTKQDVLASLAGMRTQMSQASAELRENAADSEKFEANASKLQQANHAYLEEAEGSIKQLDELGAAGDAEANATRQAVAEGTSRVAKMSTELDGMIEAGLDSEEARSRLIAKADAIDSASREVEQSITPAQAEPAEATEAVNRDPMDAMFDRLQTLLEDSGPEATQHVAALRIDPIADHEDDEGLITTLETEVAKLASEVLEESQAYIQGRHAMLLLEGDSFEQASERLERIRQQVEVTTFDQGGSPIKATITCAITDATTDVSREQLIDQLTEAFNESTNHGANQTFHHDGAFPTPLPVKAMKVDTKTVPID